MAIQYLKSDHQKKFSQNENKKKSIKITTDFDPVKMMRDIRDRMTEEIVGMTYEQEKEYIKKLLAKG